MLQRQDRISGKAKHASFSLNYFLCTFSFFSLLAAYSLGMAAIIGFLFPWLIIVAQKPNQSVQALLNHWPLLLMPGLCILSTLWSHERMWTLRSGMELASSYIVAIWAGSLIAPRIVVSSLLSALILIVCVCILLGIKNNELGLSGENALMGIYESKNAFSAMICLLIITSISVFLDKEQTTFFRITGLLAVLASPILLFLNRSVGAIFAVLLTFFIFRFFRYLASYSRSTRILIYLLVFTLVFCGGVALSISDSDPLAFLNLLGKDTTLTGRTFLWQKGAEYIAARPWLGTGYRDFWIMGHPEAEELWYYSHVPSGSGFNFHNEYIQMLVDLGLLGFSLMLVYFLTIGKGTIAAIWNKGTASQTFACLMFILCLLRTPIEVGIFDPYSIEAVLFCLIWVYLPPPPKKEQSKHPFFAVKAKYGASIISNS
jgi:exopolysaccharide production protein ExoQ